MFDKDRVCHYTKIESAISILKDKRIKFKNLESSDDPRECKQWNFDFIGSASRICLEQFKEVPNIFDNYIKRNSMISCFCGWNDEEMDFSNNAIPFYRQEYYRVGFARSRMWSQYADKHKSVCLVFSKKQLEDEFNATFVNYKKFIGKVQYQYHLENFVKARKIESVNILRHGIYKTLDMQLDKYYHEYFFLKLMDYRDEHEHRLVVMVNDGDPIGLSIESSLKSVIWGIDFPSERKRDLFNALSQNCFSSVKKYYLSWQEGRPQLCNIV